MKLTEALQIQRRAPENGIPFPVVLACGFTPLHMQTFLSAHLQQSLPERRVIVSTGLYGDTAGTLERLVDSSTQAVALALEWPDLDSRLGYRGAGKWGPAALPDILGTVQASLDRIRAAIDGIPGGVRVVACMPTLPLPPVFHTPGWQASEAELVLHQMAAEFAVQTSRRPGSAIVNAGRLAEASPAEDRLDLKADLLTGLPYTPRHADAVGALMAPLLAPPPPKKGLITDLDDTLWHGIVGEIGADAVSWDLASHHQLHGLYQNLLAALAEEGVLIAIASKNDPDAVQQALKRPDLLLPAGRVFPVEANWSAKSASVARILETWNIGADSVVFVDDSLMELAEVSAAHPGIECIPFPTSDYAAACRMLTRLRDLFGKPRLSDEDALRLESIRRNAAFQASAASAAAGETAPEAFLEGASATVTLDFDLSSSDGRALELVNKTNQFNLNGVRFTAADWNQRLSHTGAFLITVSYRDKFGPLGKIAVLQGRHDGDVLHIGVWVMSCRAFSRRIEHQCLKTLLECSGAREIRLGFRPTPKNGPLQEFLESITGRRPDGPVVVARDEFEAHCPPLYHRVEALSIAWTTPQPA